MTYFTGLARVAKTTGYPVVERPGWKTRGHGQMGAIKTVICHHTASAQTGNAPALGYVESNKGALPGPLAHFVLGRDGTIYVVAAGLCWHAGAVGNPNHGNTHAIGIEAENDGKGEKWGPAQYDSYVKLCAALVAEFKLPVSAVLGHKEIAVPKGRKIDPTFDMGAFRAYVAKGKYLDEKPGNVKPATPSNPKPKPSGKGWPAEPLPVTSKHTAASDKAWHELMAAIGYKDKNLTTNVQRWLSKLRDPRTGKGYYTGLIEADHGKTPVFGPMLVEALQKKLYDTAGPGGKPAHIYYGKADGSRGSATIRAEIAYLNLPANRGL
ncbi:N-acetylmuramoyl-L-alanine amidase [Arthrobacter sp.]|uniref:peptidoglycan recognition protein family protein n=1 Tax=Arthrobacter sp. TaxID=1667 RepID=UPI003A957BB6